MPLNCIKICFLLLTFNFLALTLALPYLEPEEGIYTCYSGQDPFAPTMQATGATLEIKANLSYTFTTGAATEDGIFATNIFAGNESMSRLFQSGSVLSLKANTGTNIYEGSFYLDYLGGTYVIIQNSNGLYIRCNSDTADIASAFEAAAYKAQEGDGSSLPDRLQVLEPTAFQPGGYVCSNTVDSVNGIGGLYPGYYPDDEPSTFYVLMFPDSTTLTLGQDDIFSSDYSIGTYSVDSSRGRINAVGGSLGGLGLLHGKNTEGKTLLYSRQSAYSKDDEGNQLDIQYISTHECEYDGPIPAEMSTGVVDTTPKIDPYNLVVNAGKYDPNINVQLEPIVDMYYCYPSFGALEIGEGFPRYVREAVLEILPNHRYRFEGGEGEFRTGVEEMYLQWLSGPLNPTRDIVEDENDYGLPHSATVEFDDWGSSVTYIEAPVGDTWLRIDCFQGGAREQKALLDVALLQPIPTTYACLPSGDNPQPVALELLPGNRYRFDGKEGSYETFIDEDSSYIAWESGPLRDDTTYRIEDETGLRTLEFSFTEIYGIIPVGSSTETTMMCQAVTQANLIPKYSNTPAPPLPQGAGGLNGFYAKGETIDCDPLEGRPSYTEWSFYHFLPDGSVYNDGFVTGDECSKTYPNGKPVCQTYSLQGNVLTFGNAASVSFLQADNGGIILDGVLYDNKGLNGTLTLNGTYEYTIASSSPLYLCTMGNCSSSISTDLYTFSPGGRYDFSNNSSNTFSAGGTFGNPGVYGGGSDSDQDSGTYTLSGNTLTFHSDAGYTKQCAFFLPTNGDTGFVNICRTDYFLKPNE